jgi:hypothetical protein
MKQATSLASFGLLLTPEDGDDIFFRSFD